MFVISITPHVHNFIRIKPEHAIIFVLQLSTMKFVKSEVVNLKNKTPPEIKK